MSSVGVLSVWTRERQTGSSFSPGLPVGTRLKSRGDADVAVALACGLNCFEFVFVCIVTRSCCGRVAIGSVLVLSLDSRMCRAAILLYALLRLG